MRYQLLGPIEIAGEDGPLPLGGGKQRALLVDLLLHANRVVASEQLLEDLWGGDPRSTGHELQVYVSRLRKLLRDQADGGSVVTRAPGYMLVVGPHDTLDVDRFEVLHREAQDLLGADPAGALERFDEALGLWRGPALGDLATEPFASPAAARLEGLRRSALEGRLEAKLALGRHEEVAAEAPMVLADDPLGERAWGSLMVALYRCGRQAEALQAYQDVRARLGDELGVDPGPELARLHTAILQHDPALDLPARPPVRTEAPSAPPIEPRGSRRALVVVLGAIAVLAAVVGVLVLVPRDRTEPTPGLAVGPNTLVSVDAESGEVEPIAPIGDDPLAVVIEGSAAWVANVGDRTVSVIDLATGRERARIGGVGIPTGIAAGLGSVWVADSFGGMIVQIDAQTMAVVRQIHRVGAPTGIAFGFGSLWATDALGGRVVRLDPATGLIQDTVRPPEGWAPTFVAVGEDAVWVASGIEGLVARLDPQTMDLVSDAIAVCCQPTAIAAEGSAVWVVSEVDPHAVRIDGVANAVATSVPLGQSPRGVAVDDEGVWIADPGDMTLRHLDAAGEVTREFDLGFAPSSVVVDGDRLVVTLSSG